MQIEDQVMILEDGSKINLIHYCYLSPAGTTAASGAPLNPGGPQSWKIACTPTMVELSTKANRPYAWRRSDDPRAVTCPLCKKTPEFIGHCNLMGLPCEPSTSNS